jgi:hypothetical protein
MPPFAPSIQSPFDDKKKSQKNTAKFFPPGDDNPTELLNTDSDGFVLGPQNKMLKSLTPQQNSTPQEEYSNALNFQPVMMNNNESESLNSSAGGATTTASKEKTINKLKATLQKINNNRLLYPTVAVVCLVLVVLIVLFTSATTVMKFISVLILLIFIIVTILQFKR